MGGSFPKVSYQLGVYSFSCVAVCCVVLPYAAVCCSVLQCVAVCWQCVAVVAVCCSVLQCVAVCCSVQECPRKAKLFSHTVLCGGYG